MWFLPIRSLRVGWEQHVSESSNHTWTSVLWVYPDISKKQLSCNSQCLSHFIALFIVVGDETRNDSDNNTLIEDGSGMCWTSGPPGMRKSGCCALSAQESLSVSLPPRVVVVVVVVVRCCVFVVRVTCVCVVGVVCGVVLLCCGVGVGVRWG